MNNLLFSLAIVLLYTINTCHAVTFKVICAPYDYGGTGVSVNIDGTSYPMTSAKNDILYEYNFEGKPNQYYYEITGTTVSELSLITNPRTWDPSSTSTLYEIFGRPHTVGDDLLKTIPRLYEPLEAYKKFSQLFQEGEISVINVHMSTADYANLISINSSSDAKFNVEFDYYTPYEKYHYTNVTLKLSGQGSVTQEKKPYKFDLSENKAYKDNTEIFNRKEFKLRSLRYDESYIKNKLVEDIAESLGLPVTQSSPFRLYLNNKSYGLYELSDMYKKKFIKRFFNPPKNNNDVIYGSLYKGVSIGSYPAYLYSDFGDVKITELYDNVVTSTQNPTNPYADLQQFMTWLSNLPENASREEIEKKFDVICS